MKILVFADSHLSTRYNPEFLNWVKYWAKNVDKIIICGDFWDSYFCTFDEFLNSRWKEELFPLLKSKNTVYIYGNHDKRGDYGWGADIFSDIQEERYSIKIGEKPFQFEHGDRFVPSVDTKIRLLGRIGGLIQSKLSQIFGKGFFEIFKGQTEFVEKVWKGQEAFLVCGHIHYPYIGHNYCILGPSNFKYNLGLVIDDGDLIPIQGYEEVKKGK